MRLLGPARHSITIFYRTFLNKQTYHHVYRQRDQMGTQLFPDHAKRIMRLISAYVHHKLALYNGVHVLSR